MTASKGRRRTTSKAGAGEPSNYSQLYKSSAAGAAVVAVAQVEQTPVAERGSESVDWKNEYSYVLGDLRKLLIVTAALILGILVLGFFL
jgi:hypothetical protein